MGPGFAGAHCFSQDFRLEAVLKMSCEIAIPALRAGIAISQDIFWMTSRQFGSSAHSSGPPRHPPAGLP